MLEELAIASLALAVASAGFVAVLVARRLFLSRRERARRRTEDLLRPQALALAHGDEHVELPPLSRREAAVFAELLGRLSRSLAGDSRARIAAFFEETGQVHAMIRQLRSRRGWRRATAAYAVGNMASAAAVPALLAALQDRERDVRAAATLSLGRLAAADAVAPLIEALVVRRVPAGTAGHALLSIGTAALHQLRGLVRHSDSHVRAAAAQLLGLLGDPSDARLVETSLRDTAAEVRGEAARALGSLGARGAAASLEAALDDRVPAVRAAAAEALGRVGGRNAVDKLVAVASHDRFEAARAAAKALAALDPAALSAAAARPGSGPHLAEAADLAAA